MASNLFTNVPKAQLLVSVSITCYKHLYVIQHLMRVLLRAIYYSLP